jgi:DNA helicase HerA-like ATPase
MQPVGMVLGTQDATPLQFWFAVAEGAKVQLDDIVAIKVPDPSDAGAAVQFYGVVDEVRRRLEGVQFDGDTELVAQGLIPAGLSYAAHVLVTRVEPEEFIPPGPGDAVYLASGEALAKALYLDNMEAPLPAGVLRNGEPGYLNFDFISGQKGAHINISGISGIATKTSYALFLLYSIFNAANRRTGRPLVQPNTTKAIVFNVKGEDLLFLDRPNKDYPAAEQAWQEKRRSQVGRYALCGLPVSAFSSLSVSAPAREGPTLMAEVASREGVKPYLWTLQAFAAERLLSFVFADRDAMSNLGFLLTHVEERLANLAAGQPGPYLEVERFSHWLTPPPVAAEADDFAPLSAEALFSDNRRRELRGDSERLSTFYDLLRYLRFKLLGTGLDDFKDGDPGWVANMHRGTREAFIRRLMGAAKHVARLVRGDLSEREVARARLEPLTSDKQVHVVDIHSLAPLAQMFVVGVLLRQVFEAQEARHSRGQVFVVLDELNKYAPAEGDSPIKDVLLDIAERGRSLGIILIGAQQTASQVERRVVANAAIRVVGRLDAAEAERPEYRFMPRSFLGRSTILAPGTMIVQQPDVPQPMLLNFPFPAWATRKKEALEDASDARALAVLE